MHTLMLTQQMLPDVPASIAQPDLIVQSSTEITFLKLYPAAPAYCPQRQRNIYNPQPRLCLMRSNSKVNERCIARTNRICI